MLPKIGVFCKPDRAGAAAELGVLWAVLGLQAAGLMDKIYIEDLQIDTVIGIYDWERQIRQVISLDIEMSADIHVAAATDRVEDTVNYKSVAKRLIDYVRHSRFELIETLIERVAGIILYEYDVAEVRVRLSKPGAVRYSRNVGIEIARKRVESDFEDIYLSIGSNIDPLQNIPSALAMLKNEFAAIDVSPAYRNPAVGFDGDDFVNLAVAARTAMPLDAVLAILNGIEAMHRRDRSQPRFSSRTLDLDLLMYGQSVIERSDLQLPREDILKFAFVLGPLAELAPDLHHPVESRAVKDLWRDFQGERQLEPIDMSVPEPP